MCHPEPNFCHHRCVSIWTQAPATAAPFVSEMVEVLTYMEPALKLEEMPSDSMFCDGLRLTSRKAYVLDKHGGR